MAHDVFISYATENKAIADATCAALEARGIRCWIAPRDVRPGSAFPVAISKAIAAARVTIVVLSGDANRSPHVRKEALLAFKAGAHIIPLRVENVIPGEGLEYVLEGEHWLDAMTPPLETHLRTLADTIGAVLSLQPAASPPPIAPPREQTSGRSDRPVPDPVDTTDTVDSEKPSRGPLASRGMLAAIVLGLITIVGLVVLIPTLKQSGAGPPQSTTTGSPKPPDTGRIVAIEQDGAVVPERGGEIRLRRAPFTMVLTIPVQAALSVHVSTTEGGVFERVQSGGSFSDVFRAGGALDEPGGNEDRTLVLSAYPGQFHYWYYKDANDHRFDSVEIRQTTLVARRTVSAVVTTDRVAQRLDEFAGGTLFFIVALASYVSFPGPYLAELDRQTFKVVLSGEPRARESTRSQLAGAWNWSELVQAESGATCTSNSVLMLEESAVQLSGTLSGTQICANGDREKFSARLETGQISGARVNFKIGPCRYQGTIAEAGTRMKGTVECALTSTALSGSWQAVRR